ncbi:MAG: hypothetical protein AB7U82_21125 [Blastocatellales bacterium]
MSDTVIHNERDAAADDHDAIAHEPNTVSISGVVKFLVTLSVMIVVAALLARWLFHYFDVRKAREAPPASPLAAGVRLPPEPRLQGAPGSVSSPTEDIRRFIGQENQTLDSYGWIDRQNGVIRIPIEQAKSLIVQRGLPAAQPNISPGAEKKQ